jgi:hypothetical protein
MAVALLIAAVLLLPLAPTHEAHAGSVVPEGAGLVDPATGEWHLRGPDGFTTSFYYGNPGDFPIMGDWNCDDVDTPGLYRQFDGYVYLRNGNSQGNADIRFYFGNPGDIPLAGDFNGDGCDTVSIYRQSEGRVYVINDLGENDGGLGAADYAYYFGNPGDKPFVGDFDGDGIDTVGLHRESTGLVYFRNSNTQGNAEFEFYFGDPGDRLIAGDWNGDGKDSPGLFRPSDAQIYLRYTNTQGNADEQFDYGIPRMIPVTGTTGIKSVAVADRDWDISAVTAPVEWGRFASLGFGADGRAVISHGSRHDWISFDLALTLCLDQTCTTSATSIQPWRVSDHTSMATGADWLPVWSFHDSVGGQLVVGRCADPGCSSVSFSVLNPPLPLPPGQRSNAGILGSTAIGADGNPIVMYMTTDPTRGLWMAQCFDPACSSANLEPVDINHGDFHRFDVAVGSDGLPIYAVFDSSYGPFAVTVGHCADYACFNGTATQLQTWTWNYEGWGFPSVAIGTDGLPIIAYNDLSVDRPGDDAAIHNESVKVTHCLNVECTSHATSTIAKERADFVSIDIGGNGLPIVAYHAGGQVKVAACTDVACTAAAIVTVDPGPGVGMFTSLATDPLGMPMIAYFDGANHDLKVARLGS